MIFTWGVEQPPGDHGVRSTACQTAECYVAALIHSDVFWHLVDIGWNCGHKRFKVKTAQGKVAKVPERFQKLFCEHKNTLTKLNNEGNDSENF